MTVQYCLEIQHRLNKARIMPFTSLRTVRRSPSYSIKEIKMYERAACYPPYLMVLNAGK